ncbi:MAG: hypothetical protein KC619_00245 [Myxococcales bacterium]|nr:hypothetical protein [Myxococcales bacterium]
MTKRCPARASACASPATPGSSARIASTVPAGSGSRGVTASERVLGASTITGTSSRVKVPEPSSTATRACVGSIAPASRSSGTTQVGRRGQALTVSTSATQSSARTALPARSFSGTTRWSAPIQVGDGKAKVLAASAQIGGGPASVSPASVSPASVRPASVPPPPSHATRNAAKSQRRLIHPSTN